MQGPEEMTKSEYKEKGGFRASAFVFGKPIFLMKYKETQVQIEEESTLVLTMKSV